MDQQHVFPPQTRKIRHVQMSISVPEDFAGALRDYQAWRKANGLRSASQGSIMVTNTVVNNKTIRSFMRKRENARKTKFKYLDAIKAVRAGHEQPKG